MEAGVMRPDMSTRHMMPLVMSAFHGVIALIATLRINGEAPPNAGLAAGVIMGLTLLANGACMGSFLGTFFVCNSQQPRIYALGVVALLLIEAVALCGFMVNFIVVHRGAILGDMSYDDACGLLTLDFGCPDWCKGKGNFEVRFPVFPNFLGLVLGCIEAKFCK